MKLRTKFSLLTCSLALVIVLGVSVIFYIEEKSLLFEEISKNRMSLAAGLAEVGRESLITSNQIMLINYIGQIERNPGVSYAALVSPEGKIIAYSDVDMIGEEFTEREEGVSVVYAPIFIRDRQRARAAVATSDEFFSRQIEEALADTRKRIAGVGGIGLLIGFAGAILLSAMMTKPIKKMTAAADLIGEGKLDTIIDVDRKDELGSLAKDLNRMARKLKELDAMKQDFISSVTHEFRSPLNAMAIHFDLLFKGRLGEMNEKQKKSLTVLRNNAKRLEKFINDLLDIAKIERGKMDIEPEKFKPVPAIEEIFALYTVQGEKKNIEMKKEISPDLPEVYADPDRTKQVIANLINNAVKFTPEGGRVTVRAQKKGEDYIQISVEDSGIGIPADQIEGVFSKFEQIKGIRKKIKGQKGTGLGLAIVKGLVEGQGGNIQVESEIDKGSIFSFTVPVDGRKKDE